MNRGGTMMSTKKYRIRLTTDEQQELNALVSRGRAAAYKQTHARILLMSDESRSDGGMRLRQQVCKRHQAATFSAVVSETIPSTY